MTNRHNLIAMRKTEEAVKALLEVKETVTKIALEHAGRELPVPISEFTKNLEPFCGIERAINQTIKTLEKNG